ncbi:MAG: hypothetical protein ACK5MZ_01730 [Aestuariibaculum sp.]
MKNLLLKSAIFIICFGFISCNNDDNNEENTTTYLPIEIDYHQVEGYTDIDNGPINYTQNGLQIETLYNTDSDTHTSYHVETVGLLWLYPGRLKISHIELLSGLKKITFKWTANNSLSIATLYDLDGNVIEEQNNDTNNNGYADVHVDEGEFKFETNLENASYLIILGGENTYGPIKFE